LDKDQKSGKTNLDELKVYDHLVNTCPISGQRCWTF